MSAKDYLVIVYPKSQEPYVVRPTDKKETHFSKKEAQSVASAHLKNGGDIDKAEILQSILVSHPA